ncbi:unnamed protein product [Pedinophyceae sp. YPF-701]|nr:unnamed protein product [Pedinophyceae sp. YPF-701]
MTFSLLSQMIGQKPFRARDARKLGGSLRSRSSASMGARRGASVAAVFYSGVIVFTMLREKLDAPVLTPQQIREADRYRVSIVIPALQEEAALERTLSYLKLLRPAPFEIVVADGGSNDRTVDIAAQRGARVVLSKRRGRSRQMNAGAKEARGDVFLFLHADTLPPLDVVRCVRTALRDPGVVMGGFTPLLTTSEPSKTWWGMSIHNLVSSWLYPLVLRPFAYSGGLRLLFGDQAIFCRKRDFWKVRGFDERWPIMEDADLCMRMHESGPAVQPPGARAARQGKIRVLSRVVDSSGRRFAKWGNAKATWIQYRLALSWYVRRDPAALQELYDRLYSDVR